MSHYDIDYSEHASYIEKHNKAIADIVDWLGQSKYDELTRAFRTDLNTIEFDGGKRWKLFSGYCGLAGIQGYPVRAWFDECFPES